MPAPPAMLALLAHDAAASPTVWERIAALRVSSLEPLAPAFRAAVLAALADCRARAIVVEFRAGTSAPLALDPVVHESLRTDELQAIYYAQGTTRAKTARYSWHGYGLAVDVISARYGWFTGRAAARDFPDRHERAAAATAWFRAMGETFERHGCRWGGHWALADLPHVFWGKCKDSPSALARTLSAAGGNAAVWRVVGAT